MANPVIPPVPPIPEMGFSDAFAKALADAKTDAALLWTAIHTTGSNAIAAIEGAFAGLFKSK